MQHGHERGLSLPAIRPFDVSTYIECRQQTHSAPDVKQQLAAVRMLFDWLITGQVVPMNPGAAVRGRKHVVEDRQDPGAGGGRVAQAARYDPDRHRPRSTGPCADRHPIPRAHCR
jgi:hypothetical protein